MNLPDRVNRRSVKPESVLMLQDIPGLIQVCLCPPTDHPLQEISLLTEQADWSVGEWG